MPLGITSSYEGFNFSIAGSTGVMAAGLAAGSEIFQFRWTSTQRKVRVLNVQLSAAVDAIGFTAGSALFELVQARAWTVSGSGGTVLTPSVGAHINSNKLRTAQVASLLGDCRVATTAALGVGTKVLDDQASGNIVAGAGAAGTPIVYPIPVYVDWAAYGIPMVLDASEGFIIRATVPATGTWKAGVWVQYAEVD